MSKSKLHFLWLLLFIFISACSPAENNQSGDSVQSTAQKETLDSQNESALQTISVLETQVKETNEALLVIPEQQNTSQQFSQNITPTPTLTLTLTPTITSTFLAYWTNTPVSADKGEFIGQTPPDGTLVSPGQDFDLTFTIKNVGWKIWNDKYYLKFLSGTPSMNHSEDEITLVSLPFEVYPTEEFTISLDMIAPQYPGVFISAWAIVNDEGQEFFFPTFYFEVVDNSENEPENGS